MYPGRPADQNEGQPNPFNPWNPDGIGEDEDKPSPVETPFTIRQVETHLIFGPISRHVPFAVIGAAAFVLLYIVVFVMAVLDDHKHLSHGHTFLAGGALAAFARSSFRRQAIVGWLIVKLGLVVLGIMLMPAALGLWLRDGELAMRGVAFLGLIWLPLLEFVPKITPYQRYLTITRLLLTIPCVIDIVRHS